MTETEGSDKKISPLGKQKRRRLDGGLGEGGYKLFSYG